MILPIKDWAVWLGALGLFIYGMKVMSEGLQKFVGPWMRSQLKDLSSSMAKGIYSGAFITFSIQSAPSTAIMVVSYVNAGLLTLTEAINVLMGVNIGAVFTVWLIAILGFAMDTNLLATLLLGLSFPFLFSGREKIKHFAEFAIGLGLLLLGLGLFKASIANYQVGGSLYNLVRHFSAPGLESILLFITAGITLGIVIPSSGAVLALTMVLLFSGWIGLSIATAMVLGENIGATLSTNITARIGNIHAKRAALFHTLFHLLGLIWAVPVLWYVQPLLLNWSGPHGLELPLLLAAFVTIYAVFNTLLLSGLADVWQNLLVLITPVRHPSEEEHRLTYISAGLMSTPELSLAEARKELQVFCKLIDKMSYGFSTLLFERNKDADLLIEKMKQCEDMTDQIELELVEYLTKVSKAEMTIQTTEKIREMLSMANDLERIADIYYNMTKNYQRMVRENIKLPDDATEELRSMLDLVYTAIKHMRRNLELEPAQVDMEQVYALQSEVKDTRRQLVKAHYNRLEKNIYSSLTGIIYLDYVVRAERILAHVVNVNEASAGIK